MKRLQAELTKERGERDRLAGSPGRLRRLARIAIWFLAIYVAIVAVLFLGQDWLAFPECILRKPWLGTPAGATADEFAVQSSDGNSIQAWWLPPRDWKPSDGALIYSHGNGENVSTNGRTLVKWRDELHRGVIGFDYPGYGKSTGTPNEQSCYASAQAVFDWLVREKKVSPRDVIVVGQSMGGAMATELASRQQCRMLVTSGAFVSFPDVAQDQYFWLPARYMVHLRFDNIDKIATMQTPVFIAHGTVDRTVPFAHGERLYAAASKAPKRFFPMAGFGHAPPKSEEFYEAVRQFLKETQPTI